jgi:PAS domain S-box-containing protein
MATDRKELVGKLLFDFFEGTYHRIIKSQWESITQGISYEDQFLLFSHDGRSIWLHGTLTAVFDMYNDLTKVVFIANDITSQKKLELANNQKTEKLEEQEAQLKQSQSILVQKLQEIESVKLRNEETLEGAMDAIITINSNEEVELFNRAAEQLLGYSKNEVMGKSITEILPSKYKALSKGAVIQFLKSDSNIFKGARNEVQLNDKYGNELSVLLTISEARFGNDFTFTAFIQNISVELF